MTYLLYYDIFQFVYVIKCKCNTYDYVYQLLFLKKKKHFVISDKKLSENLTKGF